MKRKRTGLKILFFMLGCIVWAAPAHAWEFAGWYGSDVYTNVEFDPKLRERVYLASEQSGLWRSDDLGEHWAAKNAGLGSLRVALIAVAPSDSNSVYAGTPAGLFRSKDAAERWEPCDTAGGRISFSRPESYHSIAVSSSDSSALVVGTANGGVFYSKDSGNHWEFLAGEEKPLDSGSPITALGWTSADDLYAASKEGLAKYSFKEKRWRIFENAPTDITDLVITEKFPERLYAAGQNALFISDDGGGSWRSTPPIEKGFIYRLAVTDPSGTDVHVAWNDKWKGGVLSSADRGAHWFNPVKKVIPDVKANPTRAWMSVDDRAAALKASPFDPNIQFRSTHWGVWKSTNGGRTWEEKIFGAANTAGSDIFITPAGTIYAATMDQGLLRSADGGKSYRAIFPAKGYRKEVQGHVWRVLSPDGRKILATSSPWNERVNQVIVSEDEGENFEIVRSGLPEKRPKTNTLWPEGYPRAIAFNPRDPNTVYLGMDGDDGGGFFISRNGGRNWERPKNQPGSVKIYNALCVDPSDPKRIFWGGCGKGGGVYLSEDGGDSWALVFSEMNFIFDMAVSADGTVYAAGDRNGACLYVSRDHGRRWEFLKKFSEKGTAEAICLFPGRENEIAVSTLRWNWKPDGKIFHSTDGGRSWSDITGDLPEGSGAAAMAFNRKDSCLYLIRFAGSVYKKKL